MTAVAPHRARQAWAALLTAALLIVARQVASRPMLLADRFLPGSGWIEIALLSVYAGWLAGRLADLRTQAQARVRAWTLFSVVFFGQLALGLAGAERFLMTGKLHLPIPALIAAGPVYRGEGFFMLILFGVTILLVGPAWCSHLCYVGVWDHRASTARSRPRPMPRWRPWAQLLGLALVLGTAIGLRLAGVSSPVAAWLAGVFGLGSVAVMVLWSRRQGVMTHCTTWCPIGLLAVTLGKLSPLRLRIRSGCTDCGACSLACRFDALRPEHIERRRPGLSCTLCGDCVRRCGTREIEYRLLGLRGDTARAVFVALVASLHAATLGLARI